MDDEKQYEYLGATIHKSTEVHYEPGFPTVKYRWYIEAYCQVKLGRTLGFALPDRIWFTTFENAKSWLRRFETSRHSVKVQQF